MSISPASPTLRESSSAPESVKKEAKSGESSSPSAIAMSPPEPSAKPAGGPAPVGQTHELREARELFYAGSETIMDEPDTLVEEQASKPFRSGPESLANRPKAEAESSMESAREAFKADVLKKSPERPRVRRLGLRYGILKRDSDGNYTEVDPSGIFAAGDRLRLTVEVNQPGYLTILKRDPNVGWIVLFPTAAAPGGESKGIEARVAGGARYGVPLMKALGRGDQRGEPRPILLFSRKPQPDLDQILPSGKRSETRGGMYAVSIDEFMGRARNQASGRPLLMEKVVGPLGGGR